MAEILQVFDRAHKTRFRDDDLLSFKIIGINGFSVVSKHKALLSLFSNNSVLIFSSGKLIDDTKQIFVPEFNYLFSGTLNFIKRNFCYSKKIPNKWPVFNIF